MKVYSLRADSERFKGLMPVDEEHWDVFREFNSGQSLKDGWVPIPMRFYVYRKRRLPEGDFPTLLGEAPAFSPRATKALTPILQRHGELLPIDAEGAEYYAFNLMVIRDALDFQKSVVERLSGGMIFAINSYVFTPEKLSGSCMFRIPELVNRIFVTDEFVRVVQDHNLTGFDLPLLWDSDA